MVTDPVEPNFLYRFELGDSNVLRFTSIAENQIVDGEEYTHIPIDHTAPKFSSEAQDAEVDVIIHERNAVADLFTLGSPPYPVVVKIWEYDRLTDTIDDDYYKGWVIRPSFDLTGSVVGFHCKSLFHFFERESFTDSLSALSRYSIFDPRSGVDIEVFRTTVTVTAFNDARDVLTVTGITEADDWFTGGLIVAPDRDMRTILKHETVTGNKQLTLNGAFPEFTLATGFTADIYPGDDLQHGTWVVKFGAQTGAGRAFGGWPYTPNVDPAVKGVI